MVRCKRRFLGFLVSALVLVPATVSLKIPSVLNLVEKYDSLPSRESGTCPPTDFLVNKNLHPKDFIGRTWYSKMMMPATGHSAGRCTHTTFYELENPTKFGHTIIGKNFVRESDGTEKEIKDTCLKPANPENSKSGHYIMSGCYANPSKKGVPLTIVAHNLMGGWMYVVEGEPTIRSEDGLCKPNSGSRHGARNGGMWLMTLKKPLRQYQLDMVLKSMKKVGYDTSSLESVN